jgi:tetratricopeptide (TPR) repeat protein
MRAPSEYDAMKNRKRELPAATGAELVALYTAGNWSKLAAAADRATAKFPASVLGWQASGKAFLHLRKMPEAIERLSQVVRLAPANADGYNDLGSALFDSGRIEEALARYRQAVERNPGSSEALSNLGRILCVLGRYDEAASCCQNAIAVNPGSAVAHNNLGNALSELGRSAEAEVSYRKALALMPDYLDAMINLGSMLAGLSRWPEAVACYREAVRIHPNSGAAHSALGRSLSRLTGEDQEAKYCLERAIALNEHDNNIYVELGNILMRERQQAAALAMFRHAQTLQPLITWRANQEKAEFSVLFLDTPMGGSTPVNYLAGKASYDRHFHCVIPDTPVDIELLRSKADVVFNMICNADDGLQTLSLALDLAERIGRPIVNHPRLIMQTNRESIARRFTGIPHCLIPRTVRIAAETLTECARKGEAVGFHPPLLLRVAGTHGGEDFDKCDDWAEVSSFVVRHPAAIYYLIEYIDYRSVDDFFRKYRVIFVDGELFPYHLAILDHWKIHHFRTDMANHAWMREEEERFVSDLGHVFNPAQQDALRAMATATGLDYGGVDCGLDRDGRIVVFESNAAMLVHDEKTDLFAYKNSAIARIKTAFDAMLARHRMTAPELRVSLGA